ncbi:hypothetical protein [Rickettsia endosymbiont of Orchestes rusci]
MTPNCFAKILSHATTPQFDSKTIYYFKLLIENVIKIDLINLD